MAPSDGDVQPAVEKISTPARLLWYRKETRQPRFSTQIHFFQAKFSWTVILPIF
jgi:hypothetical protein